MEIIEANSEVRYEQVAGLLRRYPKWLRGRFADDTRAIDRYFDPALYEAELRTLSRVYGQPAGRMLLALVDGVAAGCVACRDLGDGVCEAKRFFVLPSHQGTGIGRALAHRLTKSAEDDGFQVMRLDTSHRQVEAQKLYRSLGFTEIGPYYAVPDFLKPLLTFFERPLGTHQRPALPQAA